MCDFFVISARKLVFNFSFLRWHSGVWSGGEGIFKLKVDGRRGFDPNHVLNINIVKRSEFNHF